MVNSGAARVPCAGDTFEFLGFRWTLVAGSGTMAEYVLAWYIVYLHPESVLVTCELAKEDPVGDGV